VIFIREKNFDISVAWVTLYSLGVPLNFKTAPRATTGADGRGTGHENTAPHEHPPCLRSGRRGVSARRGSGGGHGRRQCGLPLPAQRSGRRWRLYHRPTADPDQ